MDYISLRMYVNGLSRHILAQREGFGIPRCHWHTSAEIIRSVSGLCNCDIGFFSLAGITKIPLQLYWCDLILILQESLLYRIYFYFYTLGFTDTNAPIHALLRYFKHFCSGTVVLHVSYRFPLRYFRSFCSRTVAFLETCCCPLRYICSFCSRTVAFSKHTIFHYGIFAVFALGQ